MTSTPFRPSDKIERLKKTTNEYNTLKKMTDVIIESPSMNSRKITASIIIDSPTENVWDILTDYNNLAEHVPNLVKSSLVNSPPGTIRLFQEGAQNIIGFDFRASLVMDMEECDPDNSVALRSQILKFKLVDSAMFSSFDGYGYHS